MSVRLRASSAGSAWARSFSAWRRASRWFLGSGEGVDRVEGAVDATADDGVGGLEAAVVIGAAAQAELLAHLVGEREVQQVRDSGEEDDTAVACGGQAHADQEGFDWEGARAACSAGDERLDLLD
ncbi:hypothetical protein ACFQ8O_25600 [Streptomyces coelicoflavus]|uniref:hypothetical protein n=1 Tax=Streptomyces coelicoflavus TaxID=285562 RepID=UPI0036B2BEEB